MLERVKKIIASQLGLDINKLKPETRILEDLQADSLDMIEMITEIESEFDISITDEEVATLKTIKDVVDFCNKQKSRKI